MRLEYRGRKGEFIFAFADWERKLWLTLDFFNLPAFSFSIDWDNAISLWIGFGHWIYPFDFEMFNKRR